LRVHSHPNQPRTLTRNPHPLRPLVLSSALALALHLSQLPIATSASAGDWPRWRGPLNTGEAIGESALSSLPTTPKPLWQADLGEGFSSPVVSKGKVAILDNENGRETLRLFRSTDGTRLWSTGIDDVFKDSQGPPGPRNTPVFDDNRIYAVSCKGELQCRSVADGKLLWRTSYTNDLGAFFLGEKGTAPGATRHGNNGSPLIDGNYLIAPVGGTNGHSIVAFHKLTGKVVWHSQNDIAGYGAPIVAKVAGVKQVIAFTADGLIGLNRDSGNLLWRVPMKTAFARHVMTPVVWNDIVVAGSHQIGLVGIKLSRVGKAIKAEQAWLNKEASPNFAHPVARGPHLFNLGPRKNLQCIDLATGKVLWSEDGLFMTSADKAYAGFVLIRDHLLTLTDTGELALVKAQPDRCEIVSRTQVSGPSWANPAYVNGTVYLRDGIKGKGKLMAIPLR